MTLTAHDWLLWIAVLWPLLLGVPGVHRRLPGSHQLALVPALALVFWPGAAAIELPSLLFGTGFQLAGNGRWLLATAVVIWLVVAQLQKGEARERVDGSSTLFFMLTLAGHLGALLAADLVSFFVFSTLMGYGFYGLIMQGREPPIDAARLYVFALVIADLALFEALLLAVFEIDEVRFDRLNPVMGQVGMSDLYICMVLLGYGLRAGLWPFHLWQWLLFNKLSVSRLLLLVAVPMATAWLGLLRWLPLGEAAFPRIGQVLQITGGLALLYILVGLMVGDRRTALLPKRLAVTLGAALMLLLGRALVRPDSAGAYVPGDVLIAVLVIVLVGLSLLMARRIPVEDARSSIWNPSATPPPLLDRGLKRLHACAADLGRVTESLRSRARDVYQRLAQWQFPDLPVTGWASALVLFVMLMLMLAWLSSGF